MRPSLRSWRGLGLAVLVTVFLAPPAIRILALGVPDAPLWADLALLEIDTLHAARAPHLVGPYSRFMWHHPGPAYAYLMLPLYEAFGERSGGLFLGALAIALASALGLVGLGVAMAGYGYGVWSVALLALWVLAFGPARLASIWNPHVVVLPFALLIVASAALAAGRVRLLPFVVFVASFLVQTHLGCLPGAGLVVAIAGAMYALRRRTAGPSSGERSGALLALAVLAVAWALPLYEQAAADHGNLRDVARFVGSLVRPHPLGEIAPIVSGHLASIPLALVTALGGPPPAGVEDGLATALAVPALMLAPVAAWAARRRDRAFVEALCIVSGALAVAAYGIGTRNRLFKPDLTRTGRMERVASIPTVRGPSMVSFTSDGKWAFVAAGKQNRVDKIDADSRKIVASAPVTAVFTPFGLVSPDDLASCTETRCRPPRQGPPTRTDRTCTASRWRRRCR